MLPKVTDLSFNVSKLQLIVKISLATGGRGLIPCEYPDNEGFS